ncbi:HYR domain-containing protein, partial [Aestuariivivens sediminis]|uniref:HYR domain-containing protein n=1 Tax=Aestuariivivens sediminis TaxID=2913557 RepID=UPI001F57FD4D
MKTITYKVIQNILVILLFFLGANFYAQSGSADGDYCPGPGQPGDEYEDALTTIPTAPGSGTCAIQQIWADIDLDNGYFKLAYKIGNSGTALFRIYIDSDNDASTGLTIENNFGGTPFAVGGAEYILQIHSNNGTTKLYQADSPSTYSEVSLNGLIGANGNSTGCTGNDGKFLEFFVPFLNINYDPCDPNNPGEINVAQYASVAGGSTNSTFCLGSTLDFGVELSGSVDEDQTICSGTSPNDLVLTTMGTNTSVDYWEESTDGINYIQISGTTGNTIYNPGVLMTGTYFYRAQVTNTGVCVDSFASSPAIITVGDNENPAITCATPAPSYNTDSAVCTVTIGDASLDPIAVSDNCGVASVLNDFNNSSTLNGATFPLGTTSVTWTITDGAGNTATCNFDVVVIDNEDPTITCPANVSVSADAGLCTASGVNLGTPVTDDNCSVASVTNDAVEPFALGDTIVTWTVTDGSGNSVTCEQTVTVTDDEDPTITCAVPAVSYDTDPDVCTFTVVDTSLNPTAVGDNCGVASVLNDFNNSSTLNGATFPLGTTSVTWTITDGAGNTATCNFDVVVIDNEDPTITCPANVSVSADAGLCTASGVNLGTPVTDDNCSVASVTNDAVEPFALGDTIVTWTVTDGSGNSVTCEQTVTVTDDEDPTITCAVPAVSYDTDPDVCTFTVVDTSLNPTAVGDNCGVASVLNDFNNSSTLNGATFPLGTTSVTWTITDGVGNTATCNFDVVVIDNEDPTITCPANVSVSADAGLCTASGVNLGTPVTDDNCSVASVTNDAVEPFALGDT